MKADIIKQIMGRASCRERVSKIITGVMFMEALA